MLSSLPTVPACFKRDIKGQRAERALQFSLFLCSFLLQWGRITEAQAFPYLVQGCLHVTQPCRVKAARWCFVVRCAVGSQLHPKKSQVTFPGLVSGPCFSSSAAEVPDSFLGNGTQPHPGCREAQRISPCSLDIFHPAPHRLLGFCVKRVILQIKSVLVSFRWHGNPGG